MKTGITIKIKNYGTVSTIGSYGKNLHDAYKALRNLEFESFLNYGQLPEKTKYYIEYKEQGQVKTISHSVDELKEYGSELLQKLSANEDLFKKSYLPTLI